MNFDHDYPGDDNHEFQTAHTWAPNTILRVSAVGGGTIGREYANNYWHYCLIVNGEVVRRGSDLYIPEPTNHLNAAEAAFEFFIQE